MAYSQAMGGALEMANSFIDFSCLWIGVCFEDNIWELLSFTVN